MQLSMSVGTIAPWVLNNKLANDQLAHHNRTRQCMRYPTRCVSSMVRYGEAKHRLMQTFVICSDFVHFSDLNLSFRKELYRF
jgi:hypothetical protein